MDRTEQETGEMIPIEGKLCTAEEISALATKLRSVPDDKNYIACPDVVKKVGNTEFYSVVVDLYNNNQDLQFRRDATFLLRRVCYYGDREAITSLVKGGVVKHLISTCEHCADTEVMCNISKTLATVAHIHNASHVTWLARQGSVLTMLPKLMRRWTEEQGGEVVVNHLVSIVTNMTARRVGIVKEIASLTNSGVNIPEVLADILHASNNVDILQGTIDCICNMLAGTMALHGHFSTQRFIDTCFSRIKSDVLSAEYKNDILRSIVMKLTCNCPSKVTKMLVSHAHLLREIAELHTDSKLSKNAAELVNKYISCGEKWHTCILMNILFSINLLIFVSLYVIDFLLDIRIGIGAISDQYMSIRYEGYLLLLFRVIPLFYINYQSLSMYYKGCLSMGAADVDPVVSLDGSSRGGMLKYLFPWKFDSVKHVMWNLLTLLQLHPLIAVTELALHRSTRLTVLITKQFHINRLSTQEKFLANVPCTVIKGILLFKLLSSYDSDLRLDNYLTFSTILGIVALCYQIVSFEMVCRTADNSPGTLTTCQTLVLSIGTLLSVISRLFMCIVLYIVLRHIGYNWIFSICILVHLSLTFGAQVSSYHRRFSSYELESSEGKFVIVDYILSKDGVRNSRLVMIGRCAVVFCLSLSESFIVNLRHPIDLLSGHYPSTDHLRSIRYFFSLYTFKLLEVITVTVLANRTYGAVLITNLGYASLALYLLSGAMYMIYFTVLNPDKKAKLISAPLNPRSSQFCHVTEKGTKIDGKRVYTSAQYNYRLQILDPCYDCMLGRKHATKDEPYGQSKCCSLTSLIRRLGSCFNQPFHQIHQRQLHSRENIEALEFRHKDLDLLITKVRNYDNVHCHLLHLLPGIEGFENMDSELISRCRTLGPRVFRGIKDIREDELSPNPVPACNILQDKIERMGTDITAGETPDETLFDLFNKLCEEYSSLKEQEWESKVLVWCETAPTEVLARYAVDKWESPRFRKDIENWIEDKEKLAVFNSNNNNKGMCDTTIVMYDQKHSTFHITGETETNRPGWVTRKLEEVRNCCHRNCSSGQSADSSEYQPIGQEHAHSSVV